jgi:hypothetical protein
VNKAKPSAGQSFEVFELVVLSDICSLLFSSNAASRIKSRNEKLAG